MHSPITATNTAILTKASVRGPPGTLDAIAGLLRAIVMIYKAIDTTQ
jgi:hypothetical protein